MYCAHRLSTTESHSSLSAVEKRIVKTSLNMLLQSFCSAVTLSTHAHRLFCVSATSPGQYCVLFPSKQEIYFDSYIDNINVDQLTGKFWLVGIPRVTDAILHSTNLSHPSPSQAFEVKLGKPSTSGEAFPDYEIREVYANDGKELSFATTALVYKDNLLVGTVDNNMLLCQLIYY